MFGWLRKRTARLQPEAHWIVEVDTDYIQITDDAGTMKRLAKSDLRGVAIETNESGPWGTDLWWLLFGPDDRVACVYPQGATGEDAALDYLSNLPGIDFAQMAQAMGSTEDAFFPIWRRG